MARGLLNGILKLFGARRSRSGMTLPGWTARR